MVYSRVLFWPWHWKRIYISELVPLAQLLAAGLAWTRGSPWPRSEIVLCASIARQLAQQMLFEHAAIGAVVEAVLTALFGHSKSPTHNILRREAVRPRGASLPLIATEHFAPTTVAQATAASIGAAQAPAGRHKSAGSSVKSVAAANTTAAAVVAAKGSTACSAGAPTVRVPTTVGAFAKCQGLRRDGMKKGDERNVKNFSGKISISMRRVKKEKRAISRTITYKRVKETG